MRLKDISGSWRPVLPSPLPKTPSSLPHLVEALASDPSRHGLRTIKENRILHPPLDTELLRRAFRGRRTAIVGDSTVLYTARWLKALLLLPRAQLDSLGTLDLEDANRLVVPDGNYSQISPHWNWKTPYQDRTDGTALRWFGFTGPSTGSCNWDRVLSQVSDFRPDVVHLTFGLHWLHFLGAGRDVDACNVQRWLGYEEWLDTTINAFHAAGAHTIVVKTVNSICDQAYAGNYSRAASLYGKLDPHVLAECESILGRWSIDRSARIEYCKHGTMTEHGVTHLNQRIVRHLHSDPRIAAIVDDAALLSCNYTTQNDGRHYHTLNLVRIRYLATVLLHANRTYHQ